MPFRCADDESDLFGRRNAAQVRLHHALRHLRATPVVDVDVDGYGPAAPGNRPFPAGSGSSVLPAHPAESPATLLQARHVTAKATGEAVGVCVVPQDQLRRVIDPHEAPLRRIDDEEPPNDHRASPPNRSWTSRSRINTSRSRPSSSRVVVMPAMPSPTIATSVRYTVSAIGKREVGSVLAFFQPTTRPDDVHRVLHSRPSHG